MAEVLIIGSAAVSNVVYVDSLPSVSESVTGSIMYKFPGGNGVNQAISLTKLNKKAELITKVGKDDNGKIILNALKNEKVIINNVLLSNKLTNVEQTTIDKNGNYYKTKLFYVEKTFNEEEIKKIADCVKLCKYLIVNTDVDTDSIIEIIFKAYYTGKKIVLNVTNDVVLDKKLLSMVDYIALNEKQLAFATGSEIKGESDILEAGKQLILKGVKNVLVKKGEKGVIFINKQEVFKVVGKKVKTSDKQGAGDNFISAFISALIDGKNIKDAVYYANVSASVTVQRKGTVPSFPTKELIEKQMSK